jgi:hypothetical protein
MHQYGDINFINCPNFGSAANVWKKASKEFKIRNREKTIADIGIKNI